MTRRPNNQTLAEFCGWVRANRTRWFYGCELWTGCRGVGYGLTVYGGRARRVHTLIAEHYHGPAPDGRPCALHICHNRACINPAHLYWGSKLDNARDRDAVDRGVNPRGAEHGNAKLTELRVRLARRLVARGAPVARLARWFGVDRVTLGEAVNRKTWRHVR